MTLQQRVERLERSCLYWRLGCLAAVLLAVGACATNPSGASSPGAAGNAAVSGTPGQPVDADFGRVTVQQLTIRSVGGPQIVMSTNLNQAVLQVGTTDPVSTASLVAGKDGASLLLSRHGTRGTTSATLNVDDQSGSLYLQDAKGKSREIEPGPLLRDIQ